MTETEQIRKILSMKEAMVRDLVAKGNRAEAIAISTQIVGMREYLQIIEQGDKT